MPCELSIIIVNWNGLNFLPNCLKSIVENPPKVSYETVVVDNNSSDGSLEWLKSKEAKLMLNGLDLRVIECAENLGFGKANNVAFKQTKSEFLYLLNPDTLITRGSLDALMGTINADDRIGAVAPKLINQDETLQPSVWGFPPSAISILVEGLKLSKFIPRSLLRTWLYAQHWEHNERRDVPLVAAAAILIKRRVLDEVGGFDETFFMYGEDIELCVRIHRAGWRIVFEPTSEVIHLGGKSSFQRWTALERGTVQEEASIRVQRTTLSPSRVFFNSIAKAIVLSVHLTRWKLLGRDTKELLKQLELQYSTCRSILFGN